MPSNTPRTPLVAPRCFRRVFLAFFRPFLLCICLRSLSKSRRERQDLRQRLYLLWLSSLGCAKPVNYLKLKRENQSKNQEFKHHAKATSHHQRHHLNIFVDLQPNQTNTLHSGLIVQPASQVTATTTIHKYPPPFGTSTQRKVAAMFTTGAKRMISATTRVYPPIPPMSGHSTFTAAASRRSLTNVRWVPTIFALVSIGSSQSHLPETDKVIGKI